VSCLKFFKPALKKSEKTENRWGLIFLKYNSGSNSAWIRPVVPRYQWWRSQQSRMSVLCTLAVRDGTSWWGTGDQ
jgi:hypothetical protein